MNGGSDVASHRWYIGATWVTFSQEQLFQLETESRARPRIFRRDTRDPTRA